MSKEQTKVCIVGAGTAGLSALKNSLERKELKVICYEQGDKLGGTWVYQDKINDDQDPEEVYSSMYKNLRTNLPKEVMGYPDFMYSQDISNSYISSEEVLHFLNTYADHFDLRSSIKLQHEVIRIRPTNNAKDAPNWEVYVYDQCSRKLKIEFFDYIFVCNGHYTKPQYPNIAGMDVFCGTQIHSHLYRSPDLYKDQNVLIIGGGPSGVDLMCHISKMAHRVFLSHHLFRVPSTEYLGNITQKPDVQYLTKNGGCFKDHSMEEFEHIIYCTGYQYSFPFLSSDCKLRLLHNHVEPLYKHCINICHPSMTIIGLPYRALPTQLMDLQIRFSLRYFMKEEKLPEKQEMLQDLHKDVNAQSSNEKFQFHWHRLGHKQYDYYNDLAKLANLTKIKPAILKIMMECERKYIFELETYRQCKFRLLNDENFIKYTN